MSVQSGTGANGADAVLLADTLTFDRGGTVTMRLIRKGGDLTVAADTLSIEGGTELRLIGSGKQTGDVVFGALALSGGSTFDATMYNQNFGTDYAFTDLRVAGAGNVYKGRLGSQYSPGAAGKLTFDISGMNNGDVALRSTANLDLTGFNTANLSLLADDATLDHLTAGTDKITLVQNVANATQYASAVTYTTAAPAGGLTYYDFDVLEEFGDLNALFRGFNPQTATGETYHSYLMARDAEVVTVNEGHNLIAGKVMDNAVANAPLLFGRPWIGFDFQGSHYRNKTGSHVDVDTFSAALSLASAMSLGCGSLTYGAFFEYGHGGYDTFHQLASIGAIDGDGDTDYYGGGLFARAVLSTGTWFEGSARVGGVKNDYKVKRNAGAEFDTTNAYYGAHLGLGHDFAVRCDDKLGLYGRVFWNRVDGDRTRAKSGDDLRLDATDSLRTRLGVQYTASLSEKVKGYVGAAWEHEFDGKASGRVNAIRTRKAELKGSSAYMEAGVAVQARENLFFDAGAFGMLGQQRGIGGNVGVRFVF